MHSCARGNGKAVNGTKYHGNKIAWPKFKPPGN